MKEYYIRMAMSHCEEISSERLNKFIKYHNLNPSVWLHFKGMAETALHRKQHFSSKAIFEIIRWERGKILGSDGFKVNNSYAPLYSRLLAEVDPRFKDFFRHRKIKSETMSAKYDQDADRVYSGD